MLMGLRKDGDKSASSEPADMEVSTCVMILRARLSSGFSARTVLNLAFAPSMSFCLISASACVISSSCERMTSRRRMPSSALGFLGDRFSKRVRAFSALVRSPLASALS